MSLNLGLNKKIFILLTIVTTAFCIGGYVFLKEYKEILILKEKQDILINTIMSLELLQRNLLDTNLSAMDIIVDKNEHSDRKNGVSQERVKKFEELKSDSIKIKEKLILISENFSVKTEMNNAIKNSDQLFSGVSLLINTINSNNKNPKVFAKIDDEIDHAKDEAAAEIEKMRENFIKQNELISSDLNAKVTDLAKVFLLVFGVTLGLLVFVVLPTIMFYVTRDLKKIRNQLNGTTIEIQNNSNILFDVSQKMTDSSSQTASAIHASVSSMAEITSMLAQTSRNTAATSSAAKEVQSFSQDGTEIMKELSSSMNKISKANSHLQDIIKIIDDINGKTNVINEIVFKTQLLAVNASIEAARAGQNGKGFSVVANEVSNLATLSGSAAGDIKELLKTSSNRVSEIISSTSETVKSGEYVCQHAVESFTNIANSISNISEKLANIEEASKEQEIGVQQTSNALNQMNRESIKNNGLSIKNSDLSLNLKDQVNKLVLIKKALNFVLTGSEEENKKSKKSMHSYVEKILYNLNENNIIEQKETNLPPANLNTNDSLNKRKLASSLLEKFEIKNSEKSSISLNQENIYNEEIKEEIINNIEILKKSKNNIEENS